MRPSLLLLLALTALAAPAAAFWPRRIAPERAIVDWVVASGGVSNVRIGPVPGAGGLRGTIAARDVPAGDVLVSLPSNLSVPMGDNAATSPASVVLLLKRRFAYPDWHAELEPFWRLFPKEPFTKETFTEEETDLLQDEGLTKAALDEVAWARAVFEGRRTSELGPDVPPLADVLAATGSNVTWSEFQRWVSLVASYAFHLPDDAGTTRAVFLPLLDLLNHGDADVANCDVAREGGAFVARATKPIKAGDEVSFSYSWGQARPDHQFMHYGFLNRLRRDAPHLACVDLFNKTLWDCPAPDDAELGRKATPPNETEAARLQAILDGFPTTEEDDLVAAQKMHRAKDWRKAMIMEFRATRKRALRLAIARFSGKAPVEGGHSEL